MRGCSTGKPAVYLGRYSGRGRQTQLWRCSCARPHAHMPRFTLGDLAAAKATPGVVAVMTAADIAHLGGVPCLGQVCPSADGSTTPYPDIPLLCQTRWRGMSAMPWRWSSRRDGVFRRARGRGGDRHRLGAARRRAVDLLGALDARRAAGVGGRAGQSRPTTPQLGDAAAAGRRLRRRGEGGDADASSTIGSIANFMETRGALGEYRRARRTATR
jgi:hypothetical protein